ncbi:GTP cyclohydrolase 1 feedback regulatory protein [Arapaima gigas]
MGRVTQPNGTCRSLNLTTPLSAAPLEDRADWCVVIGVSTLIGALQWAFPPSCRTATPRSPERKADFFYGAASTDPSQRAAPGETLSARLRSRMPYILISTQIRLETGPTMVGDEHSDPEIMNYLGATKTTMLGNNFSEYHVTDPPRLVLDKLERIGYRVVTMTGVGQTLVWCLHKEVE